MDVVQGGDDDDDGAGGSNDKDNGGSRTEVKPNSVCKLRHQQASVDVSKRSLSELFVCCSYLSHRRSEEAPGDSSSNLKLGPHDVWYVFVVRHVWLCQKDSSNLTHTVRFDVSIYHPTGEPDVTNERMTCLLKLDTFFHTHDARIMTRDASEYKPCIVWT